MPRYELGGDLRIDYGEGNTLLWDKIGHVELRAIVTVVLFGGNTLETRLKLAQVLGFNNYESLRNAHTMELNLVGPISDKLRLLSSEHSYAIYKAMLARQEK